MKHINPGHQNQSLLNWEPQHSSDSSSFERSVWPARSQYQQTAGALTREVELCWFKPQAKAPLWLREYVKADADLNAYGYGFTHLEKKNENWWAATYDGKGQVVRAFLASDQSIRAYQELREQGYGTCPREAVYVPTIAAGTPAKPAHPYLLGPLYLHPDHWEELKKSAIAEDVAEQNCESFGPGTDRHWEDERAELIAHARLKIQTASIACNGHQQNQPAHLAAKLINLGKRYQHLEAGGWRSSSEALPGITPFDQWKPNQPRAKHKQDSSGNWYQVVGQRIKYEAPPGHPNGGGLLLPQVPFRCWHEICKRQNLPFPSTDVLLNGFWQWAIETPKLKIVITEGWKKALAAVSAGFAAVALPGVQMGRRVAADGSSQLIAELQQLSCLGRHWQIVFDVDAKRSTAAKVSAAAGALAVALRSVDATADICRLPLLPNTDKTGLDDLLYAIGVEAFEAALANVAALPVLPWLRPADLTAPAGQWLGDACPLPTPEKAPLVVVKAPMGCGKTQATAEATTPLMTEGVPILMPSHRKALGQAAAEAIGVPWCPAPGSPERQQGVAGCWDSWASNTALRISGASYSGGVFVVDEWCQAIEHLLLSTGTALAKRRAEVLRTAAEQLSRMRQIIALDAQLSNWAVELLERLSGTRALIVESLHQPMKGRPLFAPNDYKTAQSASKAFKGKLGNLIADGKPFLCWTSAQQGEYSNSALILAKVHLLFKPDARILVIDSTRPESAAAIANAPDSEAAKYDAIYCTPAISSGISFNTWKPAAVIAYAGGHIAPEHVAQALARVRCPEIPAYIFAPIRAPGAAMRVGSGATNAAKLIKDLRAIADPLYGQLVAGDTEGAWLQAWAELGAYRNRQRFAYAASIAGLLVCEGWALQANDVEAFPEGDQEATQCKIASNLYKVGADEQLINAPPLTDEEAKALSKKQRLSPEEKSALDRYQLLARWGHPEQEALTHELLKIDREGLLEQLKMRWLLETPEAQAMLPSRDKAAIAALDAKGMPFEPDRPRVTMGHKLAALQAVQLQSLLQRFKAGEAIAANDPEIIELHRKATVYRGQLVAALGIGPGKRASGTLKTLLGAIGWSCSSTGRLKDRAGDKRDVYVYQARPLPTPQGIKSEDLADTWLSELTTYVSGAKFFHIEEHMEEKSPTAAHEPAPLAPKRLRASWLKLSAVWGHSPNIPTPAA